MGKDRKSIAHRIEELDSEWDIERAFELNASVMVVIGSLLGIFISRWWFVFTLMIGAFLLQHALQGWCPPLPLFRRLGIRTAYEIDQERVALKYIRGDFESFTIVPDEIVEKADLDKTDEQK